LAAVIFGVALWLITGWLLAFIANAFGGNTETGETLRVAGFVQTFGLLSVLALLILISPSLVFVNTVIAIAVICLTVAGYYVCEREIAQLSTAKAFLATILVTIISFLVILLLDRIGGMVVPNISGAWANLPK
jgi:hypothetical protein